MEISILEVFRSIFLGIVQGLSEFLPISSSGHLVIIPFLLKWDFLPLYSTVSLHFATLLSLIVIFYRDIWRIISVFLKGIFIKSFRKNQYFKLAIFIIIGSIPAAIIGFFLNDFIESFFSKPLFVAIFLIITALILIIGEFLGNKIEIKSKIKFYNKSNIGKSENIKTGNEKNLKQLNYFNSFIIGIGQAIAIFPGLSRSGLTISFGRFFGIKREECVKFSFFLSIPVIFGAFIFEVINSSSEIFSQSNNIFIYMLISFIFSFLSGVFAIKFLLNLAKKRNLNYFAVYCILISIITFIFIIAR